VRYEEAMRWLAFGTLIPSLAVVGCAEIVIDPAHAHQAPVVESYDATIDEDAAMPDALPAPVPPWAAEDAPPPAFPPPAVE